MVAGLLLSAGIASAQDTTTEPLSGYTTTPTQTTEGATQTTEGVTTEATPTPTTEAQEESSGAPTVAAQPAGSAPNSLAFTGGEPLLLIIAGLAITGGPAARPGRDRRRGNS